MSPHPLSFASLDFDKTPFLVIWEVTQACPLACRHCRAEAQPNRSPDELTTEEGKRVLDQIHALGTPVCVLTGGDPARREDLEQLVRHGTDLGLRMATIPVASSDLTRDRLARLKDAGVAQLAFSLDGALPELHDGFRQVPETFERTLRAIDWVHQLDVPLQINTTVARYNAHHVDSLIEMVERLDVVFWEVFSLVPVGRGAVLESLSAAEHEVLFDKLYALSQRVSFVVKVTEAPHYRRYVLERRRRDGHAAGPIHSRSAVPAQLSRELSTHESFGARAKGINSGKGFCFVSHTGEVYPSGFFPKAVGSLRERSLQDLYRDSELFRDLRNPRRLHGRCGACEFMDVCGGSRARAYATTGDWAAEDPACGYVPRGYRPPAG
jgi:AdoMet-dependent heme synthase